jgi:hypothetical protein
MVEHGLEEIKVDGMALMMHYLQDYASRKRTEASEFEKMTEANRLAFRKRNRLVSISLQKGTELWIDPMHWLSDGIHMTSLGPPERVVIRLSDSQSQFFRGISDALNAAD